MGITIADQEEVEQIRLELDALYRHLNVFPFKEVTNTARGYKMKVATSATTSPEAICGRLMAEMDQHATKCDLKDLEERLSRKLSGRHEKDLPDKNPKWSVETSTIVRRSSDKGFCDFITTVRYPGGIMSVNQRIVDTEKGQQNAMDRVRAMVNAVERQYQ